jgi:hypothetical protein
LPELNGDFVDFFETEEQNCNSSLFFHSNDNVNRTIKSNSNHHFPTIGNSNNNANYYPSNVMNNINFLKERE